MLRNKKGRGSTEFRREDKLRRKLSKELRR
jgi:hypothetical protein